MPSFWEMNKVYDKGEVALDINSIQMFFTDIGIN